MTEAGDQRSEVGDQRSEVRRQETGLRIKESPVKSSFGGLPMAAFNRASRR